MTRTVLHVRIVTGQGGGPEKTILNSPRHLEGTGYRALAAYLHDPDDPGFAHLERLAAEKACPLLKVTDRRPLLDLPRVLRELSRICAENNVAIWHGHDYKSNLLGWLLAGRHGLELATTVHGWVKHTSRTPLYYAIDRFALRRYRAVVCVSQDLVEACRAAGIPDVRLTRIDNAIDTEEFRRRVPAAEAPGRDAPPGRLVIGAVGRLSEEKGFDLLVRAVETLVARGRDVELRIAGEGDRRAALEAQISASPHRDRLRLLGFRGDTRALFETFDLFCLSSYREGLPNVVLEAMAMEVPVVATRSGGMEAFAREGEDALLCRTGSADALADALDSLVADPQRARTLARAARERIERECSFAARMERMVAVYDGLFAG